MRVVCGYLRNIKPPKRGVLRVFNGIVNKCYFLRDCARLSRLFSWPDLATEKPGSGNGGVGVITIGLAGILINWILCSIISFSLNDIA